MFGKKQFPSHSAPYHAVADNLEALRNRPPAAENMLKSLLSACAPLAGTDWSHLPLALFWAGGAWEELLMDSIITHLRVLAAFEDWAVRRTPVGAASGERLTRDHCCPGCGADKGSYHRESCEVETCPACEEPIEACTCSEREAYALILAMATKERPPVHLTRAPFSAAATAILMGDGRIKPPPYPRKARR